MSNQVVVSCPVCIEEMDRTDLQLKPCDCGYEICVWCWNHIIRMAEQNDTVGKCPACRAPYDKERILRNAENIERSEKQNSQKQKMQNTKSKQPELPKDLDTIRVIQRNLVYVSGVPVTLAEGKTLKKREYFGKYGKVVKIVLVPSAVAFLNSRVVYITFSKVEEAIRCIEAVDGFILDGCPLKACFGTTRYCHTWLKNRRCRRPNCLYVHDVCSKEDICTKDDVATACSSKLQKSSGCAPNNLLPRSGSMLPPPMDASCSKSCETGEKTLPQPSAHEHFTNGKMQPDKDDGRKYSALPQTASWASTPTSTKISYVNMTVSQGTVDHSQRPSNFVWEATDTGEQVPPPFQNISQSDDQIYKPRYSMTMPNGVVNDSALFQQHIATGFKEHKDLPNSWASDPTQVDASRHNRLGECSDQVLPNSLYKTKSITVDFDNSYGISTSSTGNLQILDTSDVRSSTCAVASNSLLENQGKLASNSYADGDFNIQGSGYQSHYHIPPLWENSIINGNIGDSPVAGVTSDVLALDIAHDDHLIGSSLARHITNNGGSGYPITCDSKTAGSYSSANAFNWMDNLDHAKTNYGESNVFNVEYSGLLDDAKRSTTHIYACHMNNGSPALQVKEHKSFSSRHSLFSTNESNESQSLFISCQSGLTSKVKGSQFSAIPAQMKTVPPGFHAQVAKDPDPPFLSTSHSGLTSKLKGSQFSAIPAQMKSVPPGFHAQAANDPGPPFLGTLRSGSSLFSWEMNSINSFSHHRIDDYATGNYFESVTIRNERTSTTNDMHWQNGANNYDPWGSSSMGGKYR